MKHIMFKLTWWQVEDDAGPGSVIHDVGPVVEVVKVVPAVKASEPVHTVQLQLLENKV